MSKKLTPYEQAEAEGKYIVETHKEFRRFSHEFGDVMRDAMLRALTVLAEKDKDE